MANLTTLDIKQILELVEVLEAIGTESLAIQQADGTYKHITLDNLKKTFLPYTGALYDVDLNGKNLSGVQELAAQVITSPTITNIISSLTTHTEAAEPHEFILSAVTYIYGLSVNADGDPVMTYEVKP